jgi:ribonuclease R
MLLRSMQQAIYGPSNSGHFGLSYEAYTHFTSPIRRYPDLLVHRVIKAILAGKRYHLHLAQTADAPKPARGSKAAQASREEAEAWEGAGAHCSANERRADEASRDVEAWLKCKYMREHLGEEYGGTVSAVTSFGLFVQLDELYVEGLVHITELGGEYFRFDEARQELRGERTGVRYATGARVRVQVSRVDLDGRKIDFRLVRDGVVPRGHRGSDKSTSAVETLKGLQEADRAVKKGARKGLANKKGAAQPAPKGRASAVQPDKVAAARRAQEVRAERKGKRTRRG